MESGRGKFIEEKSDEAKNLRPDFLRELFNNLGPFFIQKEYLGKYLEWEPYVGLKEGPGEKPIIDPLSIIALYMAYINNAPVRKILAPYFLDAIEACKPEEIALLVQSVRPSDTETYRAIEKIGKTTKSIEAYICYVFVTADINELDIQDLNGVMNYLQHHHPDKINTFNSLKATLTALALTRENKKIDFNERDRSEISWPPSDIHASHLCDIHLPRSIFTLPPYYSSEISRSMYAEQLEMLIRFTVSPTTSNNVLSRDINFSGFFYCNFSSLKISNIKFDNLPKFVNFENAALSECKLRENEFQPLQPQEHDFQMPAIINCSKGQLNNVKFDLQDNCVIVLTACRLFNINFLKLLPIKQENKTNTGQGRSALAVARMLFDDSVNNHLVRIFVNHETLGSPELISLLAAAEHMLTQPHPKNADLINFFSIQLPGHIATQEALIDELNKYSEAEKIRSPEEALANTPIRIMLLIAVLDKLQELSDLGIDIKPFYEAAFNHPCFSEQKKNEGLFKTHLTDNQKVLKMTYDKMMTEIEQKKILEKSSDENPKI